MESVDVPGCDYKSCVLKNGTEIVATVKLKLPWDADTLTLSGYGKWGFFSSEFTFPDKNVCNLVTPLKCPLKKGQYTDANIRMVINVPFTGITPYVTIEAWDHKGKKAFCVRVEIKIVKWCQWIWVDPMDIVAFNGILLSINTLRAIKIVNLEIFRFVSLLDELL